MSFNFITAAEAASYIKDGDIDYRSFDGRFL